MINVQIIQCGAEYQIKRIVPQSGVGEILKRHTYDKKKKKKKLTKKTTLDVFKLTDEKQES